MRITDRIRRYAACAVLLAGATLPAGCSSVIEGTPVASPGDAGAPEPPILVPEPSTPRPAPSPSVPGGVTPLEPDERGYVFIETKSGNTRCQLSAENVGCEAEFTDSPAMDDGQANGVNISADGEVDWVLGNLGAIPTVAIDYRTYAAVGWTIEADFAGTRFTNDDTGHGMFVSIESVETF